MFAKISKCATFYQSGHTAVIQNIPIHRDKWDFCVQVQVFLFDPKSMNNCIIFLFRAGGATWCLLTIIIYCYELVTTENIIHSFTICILCRTQHHAMLARPQGGDYEFKLAFEIIPKWEGWDNQNIFWCQLPTGTWHWHQDDRMKTGNWCGETGTVMGSLTIPTVLTINAFSYSPPVQFATLFCENHSVLSMMLGTGAKCRQFGYIRC